MQYKDSTGLYLIVHPDGLFVYKNANSYYGTGHAFLYFYNKKFVLCSTPCVYKGTGFYVGSTV